MQGFAVLTKSDIAPLDEWVPLGVWHDWVLERGNGWVFDLLEIRLSFCDLCRHWPSADTLLAAGFHPKVKHQERVLPACGVHDGRVPWAHGLMPHLLPTFASHLVLLSSDGVSGGRRISLSARADRREKSVTIFKR